MKRKEQHISGWIDDEKLNIQQLYELKGVVIAPNVYSESKQVEVVSVIYGEDAVKLLVGLQ